MTAGQVHAGSEPPFVGRDAEMAAALTLAGTRPGLLVVVGATWVGRTRFSTELATRLEADGAVKVRLRGGGTLADRLASGLTAAGLRPEPVTATRLRPFAALVDDVDESLDAAWEIGAELVDTPGLLIGCAREIPVGPAFVELPPLADDDARTIALDIGRTLGDLTLARLLGLAAGRPGVLVPLVRANRRPLSEDAPIKVPPALTREIEHGLEAIPQATLEVARWAAVLGGEFELAHLTRLTGRNADGLGTALDALVVNGVLEESTEPGSLRMRFADPLVADTLRQGIPPADLRRRHGAVLNARRSHGDEAAELVVHAIGSSDADQVIGTSLRAAAIARERGDAAQALVHAERALAWSERKGGGSERLDAMLERGLALAVLGRWDEATPTLDDVVRRQRREGNEGAAVRAATEWARVRWYLGYLDDAFEVITANVPEGDQPLAERAQALVQGAMFAVMAGRHSDAHEWAGRAYEEAAACGDDLTAIRALDAMGISEVRSTASPDGVERLREALSRARAGGHWRQTAVTLNNESVCLLMLGLVRQAADRAQEGLDVVDAHAVAGLDAPLTHNLAEALAAMGRLREARAMTLRSKAAFERLGSRSLEPLDGMLAWLDFLEGKVPEALAGLRSIWTDAKDKLAIEHIGPVAAYHTHVAGAAGELDEARQIARTAVAHWRQTEDRVDSLGLLAAACEVLPASEAKPVLAELEAAEDAGAPIAAALVPYAKAWVAKTPTAAVPAFRDAAEKFAETGMEWWSARALMLAGENGATNQAAVDDLLEARRRFREIEATGWRARCEAELRKRGHRFVMASRKTGDNLLSAREIEVLEGVAAGLTNREIAERLYISEKTADNHLQRIYAKLAVTSRAAAVTAATERGLVNDPESPFSPDGAAGLEGLGRSGRPDGAVLI